MKYFLLSIIALFPVLSVQAVPPEAALQNPAEKLLLERARGGEAYAQLELGFLFFRRNNPVRAAYWFGCAARQDLPEAQYNLGRCYLDGYGVPQSRHRAFEWMKKAAAKKLIPAQMVLAELYLTGIPEDQTANPPEMAIAPDEAAGEKILTELAEKNHAPAQRRLANLLLKKAGNPPANDKIFKKAVEWLEKAVAAGNMEARIDLADILLSMPINQHQLRDEIRAVKLLREAADSSAIAKAKLAFAIENGLGAPPDAAAALKLYKQALAEQFVPLAAVRLGNFYLTGRAGAVQDLPKALELYRQAAERYVPEALYQYGECFANGWGTNRDLERAFELYFQAAKLDYPPAQYATGRCFASGEGTPRDERAAFYWFDQSAMRQDPRGMLEVGKRYIDGRGTEIDLEKAAVFLELALANGMNEAAMLLREVKQKMTVKMPEAKPLPQFQLAPK